MTRLFVAAWPPAEVIGALRSLTTSVPTVDGERRVPAENWHVTLRFVGSADPDEVFCRLADADLPATCLRLGPRVVAFDRGQVVIPAAGADQLAAAVRSATAGIGEPARHDFTGHLTLARVKTGVRSDLIGREIDVRFPVDDVAVVSSETRPDGAVYTTLTRIGVS